MIKQLRSHHRWLIAAIVFVPFLAACFLIGINVAQASCSEPTFIRSRQKVDEMVLHALEESEEWSTRVDSIIAIENVRVERVHSIGNALLDDDPIYGIKADVLLQTTSGTQQRLSWETWHYGRLLCPFVIAVGSGPPGTFTALPATSQS